MGGGCGGMGENYCFVLWCRRFGTEADVSGAWKVEETGQKNTVLTFYELMHGEATVNQSTIFRFEL